MIPVPVAALDSCARVRRAALFAAVAVAVGSAVTAAPAAARAASAPPQLYVSASTGTDTSPCTQAAPCATVGRALGLAASGATVNVAAGYYTENLTLNSPVTIIGAGPSATYIDGQSKGPVVLNESTATVNGVALINGKSTFGAGVANFGPRLTMNDDHVFFNTSTEAGGGIFTEWPSVLVVTDSIIAANTSGNYGGGISESPLEAQYSAVGAVTLSGDVIANNILTAAYAIGAGIYGSGLSLYDDTISGNVAAGPHTYGGGIALPGGSLHDVKPSPSQDQGIVGYHLTIADNQASSGGAISAGTATIAEYGDVTASIVAGNKGGNCAAMTFTGGYNLEDDASGTCGVGGTDGGVVGQDPQLGPVQDNGGPSWTQALPAASPAHDAIPVGDAQCGGVDQRDYPRTYPFATGCDIGAYQIPTSASPSPASLDFGSRPVGSATTLALTLANTSTETLYPHGLPQPTNDPTFTYLGGTCEGEAGFIALAPGATCQLYLGFTPAAVGPVTATFSFAEHADATAPEQVVTLTGTGTR